VAELPKRLAPRPRADARVDERTASSNTSMAAGPITATDCYLSHTRDTPGSDHQRTCRSEGPLASTDLLIRRGDIIAIALVDCATVG
jgi:hypothetical protein